MRPDAPQADDGNWDDVDGVYESPHPYIAHSTNLSDSLFNRKALQEYILYAGQHPSGGLRDKPPKCVRLCPLRQGSGACTNTLADILLFLGALTRIIPCIAWLDSPPPAPHDTLTISARRTRRCMDRFGRSDKRSSQVPLPRHAVLRGGRGRFQGRRRASKPRRECRFLLAMRGLTVN